MARSKKRHALHLKAVAQDAPRVPADAAKTTIRLSRLGEAAAPRAPWNSVTDSGPLLRPGLRWVEVEGFADAAGLGALASALGIPTHDIEDLLFAARPAFTERDGARLLTLRGVWPGGAMDTGRVAMWWRGDVVITFAERTAPFWDGIVAELGRVGCKLAQRGAGYLVYRLLDGLVDALQPPVDLLADHLDALEDRALLPRARGTLAELHDLSRQLRSLHRCSATTRRVVADLSREGDDAFDPQTLTYLHDLTQQAAQAEELAVHYRDVAGDISNLIQGMANARLNEVMRLLAAVSTIFMPLTFIVGVYGMNFDTDQPWNMPELAWAYGYPMVMASMALLTISLLVWFSRQGWTRIEGGGGPGSSGEL